MSAMSLRRAEVVNSHDHRLWASVTLAVGKRPAGLCITSKLDPMKHTIFCDGQWSTDDVPGEKPEFNSQITSPTPGAHTCDLAACESAVFAGLLGAKKLAGPTAANIEILDAAGCVYADATCFAIAAKAAVLSVLAPRIDPADLGVAEWLVSSVGMPQCCH